MKRCFALSLLLSSSTFLTVVTAARIPLLGHWRAGGTKTTATTKPLTATSTEETNENNPDSTGSGYQLSETRSTTDREQPLIDDIELLSDILSKLINAEDAQVHQKYEEFRQLGVERAANPSDDGLNRMMLHKMVEAAAALTADEAVGVLRTFSIMLNLVNAAEVQHRRRVILNMSSKQSPNDTTTTTSVSALPPSPDSMRGTIDVLLENKEATPDQIMEQLCRQKVEIVLTAHPTQVQRKSLLRKYRKISETLGELEAANFPYQHQQAVTTLQRTISSIFGSDEIRRNKPKVQQEAAGGNAVLESVLWEAVPAYLRKLDLECRAKLGRPLPLHVVPVQFSSWMGGDRDGNPNVTPEVTREVVLQQRLRACRLVANDLATLVTELAISCRYTPAMDALAASVPEPSPHKLEKYRRVVDYLIRRVIKTSRAVEQELATITSPENTALGYGDENAVGGRLLSHVEAIYDKSDLLEPLVIMHKSLTDTGFSVVADGLLTDIIRRVSCFGLSLLPLDIREESTKHTEALDAVTRYLGIGSYREWDEAARVNWLTSELSSKRPLFSDRDLESSAFDAGVVKTIKTFGTAASMDPSNFGAYVISQAQTASDVLAVMLLQKQYGMTTAKGNMMRVVPLFETLNDLTNAPKVLSTLFSIPVYVGAIKGYQEVMVGYSDSAKDAGRLAACWAQYNSQERMAEVAAKFRIELTFFHGKGGTVGRGGNPSVYRAIMSHPPNTINGRFRVTEQGEMIAQNFGTVFVAERTLDIYTAAVCRESFLTHVEPQKKWREQMERLSTISCDDYRQLVREEPRFVPYFRQATPELELGALNIGSRPAKRNPKGGVESLRAIPWTFAWAQTRSHLSAWLGVGAGLTAADADDAETLRQMYSEWPWFRETIDLIAMIVSKTDFSITKNYDDKLVDRDGGLVEMGEEMRAKLVQTRQAILDVTQSTDVAGAHVQLQRASSQIRHPYIDPVNIIQAELLQRYRTLDKKPDLTPEEQQLKQKLQDGLVLSVNAIAQGMKNSG